ncbi:MAG: AmmeMemoRadiSam system protein B [uncultured Thiotrichaceae bacterium]|uniref:AmmeMemoRadiSam system protein B n=1 Tax=uncultured Thiotrichaceae bacterium TaxID=298394 RepID=A0A6S6TII9_9GAMM|nr:MAG: AmmeMemoRadiSam system protein B [uncultured Thiotrichaceae bacterium]
MNASHRSPQHQGIFYPAEAAVLQQQLDYLLSTDTTALNGNIKALIAPHAAYDYSGRIAGQAYAALREQPVPRRLVILAPNHQNTVGGALICSHDYWATPLGELAVDRAFIRQHWQNQSYITVDNATHQAEYSIEVQLPFIQQALPGVPIVPVLLSADDPAQIRQMLRPAWDDDHTLIIISSDLYHHLPREAALKAGLHIARLIENNDAENISVEYACGHIGLRGVMQLAIPEHYFWHTLALQHSGQDNRFNAASYVGYGAFLLMHKTGSTSGR